MKRKRTFVLQETERRGVKGDDIQTNLTPSTWHQTPMTFDVVRHFSRQAYQHPTTHYRQETLTLPPPYKGNTTNWVQENNEGSHLIILCWQILHTVYRMFFNTESNKNSLFISEKLEGCSCFAVVSFDDGVLIYPPDGKSGSTKHCWRV